MVERRGYDEVIAHMAATNEKLKNIEEKLDDINNRVSIQNSRITKLEESKNKIIGAGVVMASLISIFGVIPLWIKK